MNFQKFQSKWKILQHFIKPKERATLRKLFRPPSPLPPSHPLPPLTDKTDKIFNVSRSLEYKFSYGDIQKYIDICFQRTPRMWFLGVEKWCSANAFSDTKQKNVCWEIWKVRKIFGCVSLAYYFQCQVSWVEVCKISGVFRAKLYYKFVIFFATSCWVWEFFLENPKFLKTILIMYTATCGRI